MRILLLIATLLLGCSTTGENPHLKNIAPNQNRKILLHKLANFSVVGDFTGDGRTDTIIQRNFSKLHNKEIDSAADPFQNDWEVVTKWFYNQKPAVFLTLSHNLADTLHLGPAQGLYCLLNIGDNNRDKKDEIAFVIDNLDFSQLNSCEIYTLCDGKWKELKRFDVHEDAFVFTSDTAPTFDVIKGYLEKRNGQWLYLDYEHKIVGRKMQPLRIGRCN